MKVHSIRHFVLGLLGCVALGAAAEVISLTAGDPNGKNSFQLGDRWSDGQVPNEDNDYLVALGGEADGTVALRTPANSSTAATFPGRSLTIGEAEGLEGMILHKAQAPITYPDLRLVKGVISQGSTYSGAGKIYGSITVLSTYDNPFSFIGSNDRVFYLAASLIGDETACLEVRHSVTETSKTITLQVAGTNTAYRGSLVCSDPDAFLQLVGDVDPLGPADSPSNGRALILRNQGNLVVDAAMPSLAPEKRVWVESTGGRLYTAAGVDGRFAMPVAGEGVLTKAGAGCLTFAGQLQDIVLRVPVGEIIVDPAATFTGDGQILVTTDSTTSDLDSHGLLTGTETQINSGRVVIGAGGFVVPLTSGENVTVSNAVFAAGGGVMSRISLTDGGSSCVTLGAETSVAWPLALSLDQMFPTYTGPDDYVVLKVPTALKEVTPEDFTVACPGSEAGLLNITVRVDADENGDQLVRLHRASRVVTMTATGDGTANLFSQAAIWSDILPTHAGYDYLVYADTSLRGVRTGDKNLQEYVFPGISLTLLGTSSYQARLISKAESLTVDDLRLYGNSAVTAAGYQDSANCTQNYYGHYAIYGTRDNGGVKFMSEKDRVQGIYADLTGGADACIYVVPASSGNGIRHLELYAANTNYFGSIDANQRGQGTPSLTKYMDVSIADETNLGANPPAYNEQALALRYYSRLWARQSLTVDDPNRGIYVEGAAQFGVGNDDSMTILSPITVNGSLFKNGTGTLRLGGPIAIVGEPADGGCWPLTVIEGTLQPLTGEELAQFALKFEAGAKLCLAPQTGDEVMRAKGIVNLQPNGIAPPATGEPLTIRFVYSAQIKGDLEVPLLTVTAETAEALRDHLELDADRVKNHQARIEEREVEEGVMFVVHYVDVGATRIFLR